jgi:hypothetical protein
MWQGNVVTSPSALPMPVGRDPHEYVCLTVWQMAGVNVTCDGAIWHSLFDIRS